MIRKSPHRTHRDERYFEIRCAALEVRVRDLEAALTWAIENDASWTVDDELPEDCRAVICEVRDKLYSAQGKACEY